MWPILECVMCMHGVEFLVHFRALFLGYTFFVRNPALVLIAHLYQSQVNLGSPSRGSRTQPRGGPSWAYSPYLALKSKSKEESK